MYSGTSDRAGKRVRGPTPPKVKAHSSVRRTVHDESEKDHLPHEFVETVMDTEMDTGSLPPSYRAMPAAMHATSSSTSAGQLADLSDESSEHVHTIYICL